MPESNADQGRPIQPGELASMFSRAAVDAGVSPTNSIVAPPEETQTPAAQGTGPVPASGVQEPQVSTPPAPTPSGAQQTPVETSTPVPPEAKDPFIDFATALGYQVPEGQDPKSFLQQAYQRQNAVLGYLQQQQQAPSQEPAQPPAAQPEEWSPEKYFSEQWKIPQYDPAWENMLVAGLIRKDQSSGLYVPTQGNEYLMAAPQFQALNAYESARSETMRELFSGNFLQTIYDKMLPAFDRRYAKPDDVNSAFSSRETQGFIDQYESQNAAWLYDQSGNHTERGKTFYSNVDQLINAGVRDVRQIITLAERMLPPQVAAQQQQPNGNGNGATHQASAPQAAVPAPQQPAPQQPTPAEQFIQRAISVQSPGTSARPGAAPQTVAPTTERDLQQLFVQAAQTLG